jgi:hypothetical protein
MFNPTWWMLLAIAGPVLLAAAVAYALIKQRRLTQADRTELREAVGEVYADTEENDGCPVRVDTEKRKSDAKTRAPSFDRLAGTMR